MIDPLTIIRSRRAIDGISAILLPFTATHEIDWPAFEAHVLRTAEAGLTPAVNMDTGYVNFLAPDLKDAVLKRTQSLLGGQAFVAGAFACDEAGGQFRLDGLLAEVDRITKHHGVPVIFQC